MSNVETHIKTLQEKLQQLIKNYVSLQKENEILKTEITTLKQKEEAADLLIAELQQKIMILKASAGKMSEEEQMAFQKKIDRYVKEINKCISLLSE